MKKRNTKHEKRLKRLVITCLLCAIILSVSTYAWFIGMKTVSVNAFEVNIKSTESLMLSLDGVTWDDTLDVNETTINAYSGHQNSWGGTAGLIPMSSIGTIDVTKSKMTLFEKGSLTATDGGYRLLASEVTNTADKEEDGYVAFDLFIRNMSGDEYYTSLGENEEAIYLTPDSEVTVADAGNKNAGIENSVRVAFAQIGRVQNYTTEEGTTEEQQRVQGIKCNSADTDSKVTVICDNKKATIWEPNDTVHVDNAINWFKASCKKRATDGAYTGTACETIQNGQAYTTYAVGKKIETAGVDVYDGYNGYTNTIGDDNYLVNLDTFTDTEKNQRGTARQEFFRLAPNSITKVRVYVYIEGQDVDNYDFASLGQAIKVSFGFTKERFYGEDVDYDGNPPLPEGLQSREAAE